MVLIHFMAGRRLDCGVDPPMASRRLDCGADQLHDREKARLWC